MKRNANIPEAIPSTKVSDGRLELLVTVVNRSKGEFYADLIQSFEVNMQTLVRARGTASAHMLHLLGLEDSQKTAIFSIIKHERVPEAMAALESRFASIKNGKGIAYTVPLTSVIGAALYGFLSNNAMTVKEGE